jgi:hypothetical protein
MPGGSRHGADTVCGGLLVGGLVHDQHHVTGIPSLACGKTADRPGRGLVQHLPLIDPGA